MIKKPALMCLILILAFALAGAVFAQQYLQFIFDDKGDIISIKEIEDNYFYYLNEQVSDSYMPAALSYELFIGGMNYSEDINPFEENLVALNDSSNKVVFRILKDQVPVREHDIDLCNNNGVCEPCGSVNCALSENFLSCADCASGESDSYCDLVQEGICDPDCQSMDRDCDGCGEGCYFNDLPGSEIDCINLGGIVCNDDEFCYHGTMQFFGPTSCCFEGSCLSPEEHKIEYLYLINLEYNGQQVYPIHISVVPTSYEGEPTSPSGDFKAELYSKGGQPLYEIEFEMPIKAWFAGLDEDGKVEAYEGQVEGRNTWISLPYYDNGATISISGPDNLSYEIDVSPYSLAEPDGGYVPEQYSSEEGLEDNIQQQPEDNSVYTGTGEEPAKVKGYLRWAFLAMILLTLAFIIFLIIRRRYLSYRA